MAHFDFTLASSVIKKNMLYIDHRKKNNPDIAPIQEANTQTANTKLSLPSHDEGLMHTTHVPASRSSQVLFGQTQSLILVAPAEGAQSHKHMHSHHQWDSLISMSSRLVPHSAVPSHTNTTQRKLFEESACRLPT
jgi:hypothetical protein